MKALKIKCLAHIIIISIKRNKLQRKSTIFSGVLFVKMKKKNRKWKFLIFTCLFHTLDECKNNESQTDSAVALLPTLQWNVETHTKKTQ